MYTLTTGIYNQLTEKEEYFVIILGLDNAGKTTLLERVKMVFMGAKGLSIGLKLIHNPYHIGLGPDQIGPTVGLNVGKVDVAGSRINFWDLGGQKQLQSIWSKYYEDCHGLIFVVDSTDLARIEECKVTLENVIHNDLIEGIPMVMLANKQDLPGLLPRNSPRSFGFTLGALKLHEIKEIFNQIAVRLEARDSRVMCVSALNGDGVKEAMEWIHSRVQLNKNIRPPNYTNK